MTQMHLYIIDVGETTGKSCDSTSPGSTPSSFCHVYSWICSQICHTHLWTYWRLPYLLDDCCSCIEGLPLPMSFNFFLSIYIHGYVNVYIVVLWVFIHCHLSAATTFGEKQKSVTLEFSSFPHNAKPMWQQFSAPLTTFPAVLVTGVF